jgi:hypothetical protein
VHTLEAIDTGVRNLDFVEPRQAIIDGAQANANATADALFVADFDHVPRPSRFRALSARES